MVIGGRRRGRLEVRGRGDGGEVGGRREWKVAVANGGGGARRWWREKVTVASGVEGKERWQSGWRWRRGADGGRAGGYGK